MPIPCISRWQNAVEHIDTTLDSFKYAKKRQRGITVLCTTDQFTRFLILRNQNGIKNGFMDLNPKLVQPSNTTPEDNAYDILAKAAGVTRKQAKLVALAISYSAHDIMQKVKMDPHVEMLDWDVSRNC